jgi:segregation and condensation protein B
MDSDRLRSILESLLFAADGPLSVDRLRSAIGGDVERKEVAQALKELQEEYETQQRGVRLLEVANGFQLRTPREHAEYVKNLVPVKTARMSRANLETLAIVAYKQPITKAEIEDIRGVNVDGVVSTLLERRLIRIVARKDVPGKPFLYGTTKEFLETFNLKDLSGLPTLKEMEEMTQALADAPGVPVEESEASDVESKAAQEHDEQDAPDGDVPAATDAGPDLDSGRQLDEEESGPTEAERTTSPITGEVPGSDPDLESEHGSPEAKGRE